MKRTMTLAAVILSSASLAHAATLDELDLDGDGVVTLDEVQSVYPDLSTEIFLAADSNADGALDADELAAAEETGLMPISDG